MPTLNEYNVAKQKRRELSIRVVLLNKNFQSVDELSGVLISEPSVSIASESNVRRTVSLSMHVKDSSFQIGRDTKIWLDRFVQVYVGVKDVRTKDFVETNMGIYIIDTPSYNYDATNNTLGLTCVDLMAYFTGMRNGNLLPYEYVLSEGENVRDAFIEILDMNGFTKYVIEDIDQDIPNEERFDATKSYYDMMYYLCNILPTYQMYFDVDGVFHFEEIPINSDESIFADDDIIQPNLISWSKSVDFENVKNTVTVIGATHEVEDYASDCTLFGTTYSISFSWVDDYTDVYKIGFTTDKECLSNPKVSINGMDAKSIIFDNGAIPEMLADTYYVMIYSRDDDYFRFMGEIEPRYTAVDTDPNSPFNIDEVGEIRLTLLGGEYDNIYSTPLAEERAKWELYNHTRLQDSVQIIVLPIYWMDVNKVINVTLPNKQGTEETKKYITKSITTSTGVSGTQTISMVEYYPFYNED